MNTNVKKIFKWISIALLTVVTVVALAGMYKFNYLASRDGNDCDGNKIVSPADK